MDLGLSTGTIDSSLKQQDNDTAAIQTKIRPYTQHWLISLQEHGLKVIQSFVFIDYIEDLT